MKKLIKWTAIVTIVVAVIVVAVFTGLYFTESAMFSNAELPMIPEFTPPQTISNPMEIPISNPDIPVIDPTL